jgi:DNA-binding Lrp family transcriptional regulator
MVSHTPMDENPVQRPNGSLPPTQPPRLDEIDRRLVDLLRIHSRRAVSDLADEVHVSRASAYRRLRRLEDEGVITGYTVRTDPAALGLHVAAIILVSCDQASWRSARRHLAEVPGVEHLVATTGPFDFVLRVRVPNAETLRDVVLERLHAIAEVRSTQTLFVLDEFTSTPAGE